MTTALAVIPEQIAPQPVLPAADLDRAATSALQDKAPRHAQSLPERLRELPGSSASAAVATRSQNIALD